MIVDISRCGHDKWENKISSVSGEDDDRDLVDVNEVLPVPIEKGGQHKCNSKVVVTGTHEKLESTLPFEEAILGPIQSTHIQFDHSSCFLATFTTQSTTT